MQQLKLSQGSNGSQQNMVSTFNTLPSNDLSQLINLGSWHPKENTFAVAKHNSLFLFTEKRSSYGQQKSTVDNGNPVKRAKMHPQQDGPSSQSDSQQ